MNYLQTQELMLKMVCASRHGKDPQTQDSKKLLKRAHQDLLGSDEESCLISHASSLLKERKYLQAMDVVCQAVTKAPFSFLLQLEGKSLIVDVANKVTADLQKGEKIPGFYKIFEKLKTLGCIPTGLYVHAILEIENRGLFTQARSLYDQVKKAYPHILGIKACEERLGLSLPSSAQSALTESNVPLTALGCQGLCESYFKVQALFEKRNYEAAVQKLGDLVLTPDIPVEARDFFYYYLALAFEKLSKPLDALSILSDLAERHPYRLSYVRDCYRITEVVAEEADRLALSNPTSASLIPYADLLYRVDWVPYHVRRAVALMQAKNGDYQKAKASVMALFELAPNDYQYIEAVLLVAQAGGDKGLVGYMLNHLRDLTSRYNYFIEHAELLDRYEKGVDAEKSVLSK